MTFLELQNLCLYWLDDLAASYFTRTQLKVWLNNAQRECQKQLIQAGENWYVKCAKATLQPNKGCYYIPSNFLKIHKFEVVAQQGATDVQDTKFLVLPCTPMEMSRVIAGPSLPNAYFLKKDAFEIRPYPDQAYEIEILYSYRVADMTNDTDTPDVPEQYAEYLAILATLDGFLKDQRDPSAFMAKRDKYLELMKQDAEERQVNLPRQVIDYGAGDFGTIY